MAADPPGRANAAAPRSRRGSATNRLTRALQVSLGASLAPIDEDALVGHAERAVERHVAAAAAGRLGLRAEDLVDEAPSTADRRGHTLDCQWLDITGVAPGDYKIEVTLNPNRSFEEVTLDNNTATAPVTIPPA